MGNIRLFKPADAVIIVLLVILSVAAIIFMLIQHGDGRIQAVVEQDGREIERFYLDDITEPIKLEVGSDIKVTAVITAQGAYIERSGCKDKICVNTGLLTRAGQSSVCLPARVCVRLENTSEKSDDLPDAVTG